MTVSFLACTRRTYVDISGEDLDDALGRRLECAVV